MRVSARGLDFEVRVRGPVGGEPVLLLHGFPQHSGCWRAVADRLHAAGLRTIAPDQRGYSPGARPADVRAYRVEECADDAVAILDALGLESAHVVGHDWGATAAWFAAARHPERVRTLTAVSVPHPAAFAEALAESTDQRLKSAYITLFRRRGLAERLLLAFGAAPLRFQCTATGLPAAAVDAYVDPLTEPGALTGALNWYRATPPAGLGALGPVDCPTTFVWSDRDVACDRRGAELTEHYVDAAYELVVLEGVSHWIPTQAPEALTEAIIKRIESS